MKQTSKEGHAKVGQHEEPMVSAEGEHFVPAAMVDEVQTRGCLAVDVEGRRLALFFHGDKVYAVDNRCPHMGFPLERGTLKEGILTCHWHHARFDLASGGTFDLWADDVPTFPVRIRDGQVWVDMAPPMDQRAHHRRRLLDGLERNIPLVVAKAVVNLLDGGNPVEPFRIGLDHGTQYFYRDRHGGWANGLTMLVCMMNILPNLDSEDRPGALYHGLSAVASDTAGASRRVQIRALPSAATDIATLKRWFRGFIEVRDAEGAERCIASAVRAGADHRQMADMLFAAATDHRYIDVGHPVDFTNKALEALDVVGWQHAEQVLTSLASTYADADRMEESNSWRNPVDLIPILERAFEALPAAVEKGRPKRGNWNGREAIVPLLLGHDPDAIAEGMVEALKEGCTPEELASLVAYAAALRIGRFRTGNEYNDWDTALHTFTFANAVHQGLRRVESRELLRGVFDAAMSVYLDRFLNIPPAHLPGPDGPGADPGALLQEFPQILDRQQAVDEAGQTVARYLYSGGDPDRLLATLGNLLLREDRYFHTLQVVEAAFRQYSLLRGKPSGAHVLVAAARFLAAHAPTARAQGQTYQIAYRFHRGERLYEEG